MTKVLCWHSIRHLLLTFKEAYIGRGKGSIRFMGSSNWNSSKIYSMSAPSNECSSIKGKR